jgi:hypothetical protein
MRFNDYSDSNRRFFVDNIKPGIEQSPERHVNVGLLLGDNPKPNLLPRLEAAQDSAIIPHMEMIEI